MRDVRENRGGRSQRRRIRGADELRDRPLRSRWSRWGHAGRRRHRSGRRVGRGGLDRRRGRDCRRGQKEHRVEVALRIVDSADAEVDERLTDRGPRTRADAADHVALGDRRPLDDVERAEVQQGDRQSLRRQQRERLTAGRDGPRERDRGVDRRTYGRAHGGADRDAAVLAGRLRVQLVEDVGLQDRSLDRPRPRAGQGRQGQGNRRGEHDEQSDVSLSVLQTTIQGTWTVRALSNQITARRGRAGCARSL